MEPVGPVWATKRAITKSLVPFVEGGLSSIHGRSDWFRRENERRDRHNRTLRDRTKAIKLLRTENSSVTWSFSDLLRTMAALENWSQFFKNHFEGRRKFAGVGPVEIKDNLWELAALRNVAGHDEERDIAFSHEEMLRFFELSTRILRGVGTAETASVVRTLPAVLDRPSARSRSTLQPIGPAAAPIAVLKPNEAVRYMLEEFPLDIAEKWRGKAIDGAIEIFSCPQASNLYGGFTPGQIICELQSREWPEDFGGISAEKSKLLAAALVGDSELGLTGWLTQRGAPGRIRILATPISPPVLDRPEVYLKLANSDYFTVRTITELSRLNQRGRGPNLREIFPKRWGNSAETFNSEYMPYHVSAQGVVICQSNYDTHLLLGCVNTTTNSITGGWGASMAEQMWAPDRHRRNNPWWHQFIKTAYRQPESREGDPDLRETLRRGLWEELRIRIGTDTIEEPLMLCAAIEQDMYFVTFIFLVLVDLSPEEVFRRWRQSPDYNELGLLAAYQLTGVGRGGTLLEGPRRLAELLSQDSFDGGPHLLPQSREAGTFLGSWHCSSRLRMYAAGMHLWPDEFPRYVQLATWT